MYQASKLKEIVGEPGLRPLVVKADPFSLDSLIAWLEKMPGDETYCYTSSGHCLIAQYLPSAGVPCVSVSADFYRDKWTFQGGRQIPLSANFLAVAGGMPSTFGAALSRARALRDAP